MAQETRLVCDLDYVFADWEGHIRHLMGSYTGPLPSPKSDPNTMTPNDKKIREKMLDCGLKHPDFWEAIPPMPDAKELYHSLKSHFDEIYIFAPYKPVLSVSRSTKEVHEARRKWIKNNLDRDFPMDHVIVSDKDVTHLFKPGALNYLITHSIDRANKWSYQNGYALLLDQDYKKLKEDLAGRGIDLDFTPRE